MPAQSTTTVRMLGALHTIRKNCGLASVIEVSIPSGGCAASVLAGELDLPLEQIEAVFVNHQIYSLDHCIQSGDRVAFVPAGIPATARGLLGSDGAGLGAEETG